MHVRYVRSQVATATELTLTPPRRHRVLFVSKASVLLGTEGLLTGRLRRPQLQPDGRQSPEDRQRRDRLREQVRRRRGRRRAILPRQHVPASPGEAGRSRRYAPRFFSDPDDRLTAAAVR